VTPGGPSVAVAVVSWNLRERLDACLRSLRADHEAGRAEVWVVDNASEDGSAELVRDEHPWARLIALGENRGYGPAVNLVARRTATPWVAPANADLRLEPDALRTLLGAGAAHPHAGVLAPRLLLAGGRTQHSVHPFPAVPTTLAVNLGVAHRLARLGERLCLEGRWNTERERDVPWAHGALLLVRRTAWEQVGGFDDAMWFYAEDLDLCWRLHRAGWATRYVPAARVHHDHSAAARAAWGEERLVRSQAAAYAWMRRRRGAGRTLAVAALNAGVPALRAVALAPAAAAGSAGAAARRRRWVRWWRLHRAAARRGLRPAP